MNFIWSEIKNRDGGKRVALQEVENAVIAVVL